MSSNVAKKIFLWVWCLTMTIQSLEIYAGQHHVYFVILAGGDGERLWPLSRKNKPKQLLSLYGNKTLLEQAVERAAVLAESKDFIWVTTSSAHEDAVRACLAESVGTILVEPCARNTAAAIVFSCEQIYLQDPQAYVVFLPADSFIPYGEYKVFTQGIAHALEFIQTHDALVLCGIAPSYPATGYGYIEYVRDSAALENSVRKVHMFHEKPTLSIAQEYVKNPHMLWNIGMFCAPVSLFLQEAELHCPAIVSGVRSACYNPDYYSAIPAESIDKAIIEKSEKVWVLPMDFMWYDVGNVGVFLSLKEQKESEQKNVIFINAKNNLVDVPHKLVALIDVDNLCIVETEDALLISRRDATENVKELVYQLKKEGRNSYL
jgi:mannose-1-phosphate guanylyltransferase